MYLIVTRLHRNISYLDIPCSKDTVLSIYPHYLPKYLPDLLRLGGNELKLCFPELSSSPTSAPSYSTVVNLPAVIFPGDAKRSCELLFE